MNGCEIPSKVPSWYHTPAQGRSLVKYRTKHWRVKHNHSAFIPANFFSIKCLRFSSPQNLNFWKFTDGFLRFPKISEYFRRMPKISRRLLKIAEDFPTTSEDNGGCRKIFDEFKTGPMISNQSWALLKSSKDWCECVRSQF